MSKKGIRGQSKRVRPKSAGFRAHRGPIDGTKAGPGWVPETLIPYALLPSAGQRLRCWEWACARGRGKKENQSAMLFAVKSP